MKRLSLYSIIIAISFTCAIFAKHTSQNTVISFDIDDVISLQQKVGFMDYLGLARAVFWNPKLVAAFLPSNFKKISKQAKELAKTMNGSFNVVHSMIANLKEQGYADLSDYEDEIVQRAIKPIPIKDIIALVKNARL